MFTNVILIKKDIVGLVHKSTLKDDAGENFVLSETGLDRLLSVRKVSIRFYLLQNSWHEVTFRLWLMHIFFFLILTINVKCVDLFEFIGVRLICVNITRDYHLHSSVL